MQMGGGGSEKKNKSCRWGGGDLKGCELDVYDRDTDGDKQRDRQPRKMQ